MYWETLYVLRSYCNVLYEMVGKRGLSCRGNLSQRAQSCPQRLHNCIAHFNQKPKLRAKTGWQQNWKESMSQYSMFIILYIYCISIVYLYVCIYGYMTVLYIYLSGKNNILLAAEFHHHYHHHTYKLLEMKQKTPTGQA